MICSCAQIRCQFSAPQTLQCYNFINKLLTRLNQHYSYIRNKVDTPVSRHAWLHDVLNPYKTYIYLTVDSPECSTLMDSWETWMARLHTCVPKGLNIQDYSVLGCIPMFLLVLKHSLNPVYHSKIKEA